MSIDWKRIKQVLAEAAGHNSSAERAAFLDDACHGDDALRAEVEKLLKAHDQAEGFLETPALTALPSEQVGDKIGSYKLLQQIGEGGCGAVYMAEQEQPIRRRVALKVIKLGMDTKSVIARFEAERQALALMDHPNIARVLDAGATDTGRPYFVMELVRGIKITDYCDQHHLSTEARLNLFVQVCHALQHAHQKGIIHRDIKPSNILVTLHDGAPMPKVIDFGIAKATDRRLTDKTLFTAFEQFIGTPAYTSPEQAQMSGIDIDTRSDIYSLGVLLYELLTGQTPFDPKELVSAGLDGMRRIIREQEPKRPSTRLSTLAASDQTTVAKCRQSEPPQLIHRMRGDLDWIVMRCLEKDRTRRYETANNLAEDVLRHLNNEPVTARPPSKAYQFQKLVQRNKVTFAAGALVTVALVLGLGFSLWTLAKERAARRQALAAERKAQAEAGKSQQVAQFLKDMLRGVGPSVALGRDTTMLREILDKTAERVGKDLKSQPEVEAELRMTLGEVYEALAPYEKAVEMYRTALTLRRELWGNMHTNVADSLDRLGWVLVDGMVNVRESEPLLEEALQIRTNLLRAEHVEVAASLYHLGKLRLWQGRTAEGEALYERSLAMRRRLLGNEHLVVAESLAGLGAARLDLGQPEAAEAVLREALAIQARVLPDERAAPGAGGFKLMLGVALRRQGKIEEAETLVRQVATMRQDLLGEHPNVAGAWNMLGYVLAVAGKFEEAERFIRSALALSRKTIGDRHPVTATTLDDLGLILRKTGRFAESEAAYREALAIWRSRGVLNVDYELSGLTEMLRDQGKLGEIETLYRENVDDIKRSPSSTRLPLALHFLGRVLREQNKLPEAEALLREAVDLAKQSPSPEMHREILLGLVQVLVGQGRYAEAEIFLRDALEMARKLPGSRAQAFAYAVAGDKQAAEGDWVRAEAMFHESLTICRRIAPETELHQWVAWGVANALAHQEKWAEAEPFYRENLKISAKIWPKSPRRWQSHMADLAVALRAQGKHVETDAVHREWLAAVRKAEPSLDLARALAERGDWLRSNGSMAEAGVLYREGLDLYHKLNLEHTDTCQWLASGLGVVLRSQDQVDEAVNAYREAVISSAKTWPKDFPRWEWQWKELVDLLVQQGKSHEVETARREIQALAKDAALPHVLPEGLSRLGDALRNQTNWLQAEGLLVEVLETAKKQHPSPAQTDELTLLVLKLAALQIWFGREMEYVALCRQMLQWTVDQPVKASTERTARLTCLRPLADQQLQKTALTLARQALQIGQTNWGRPWYQLSLGMAEYRNGNYLEADRMLCAAELGGADTWRPEVRAATARFYRAMSLFGQGQQASARQLFTETEVKRKPLPAAEQWPLSEGVDHDDLVLWLAYKEAQELLKTP